MEAARAAPGGRRKNLSLKLAPRARRQKETFDAAFEGFYREHVAEVYQYALAVLGNSADAEDVTQQTFLNAYRAFQRGERPQKAHNWLIKIAHNVCRMRWRQSGRRPQEVPLERAGEPAAPDDERPSLDVLLGALAKLPFNQRAAIVMREVEDRSYAEIAEVLGVSVPAVEALLFRARGNLRERRKALAGALSVAPVPTSLGSFFAGGGGGSLIAAGGTALGSQLLLKAAALVATSVVVGGLGFKAVSAVATPEPPTSRFQQLQGQARLFAANVLRGPESGTPKGSDVSAFRHPLRAVSGGGALGGPSTKDPSEIGGVPGAAQPVGGASAISAVSTSPTDTVGGVVGAVPTVAAVPTVPGVTTVPAVTTVPTVPPAVTVTTPVTSATVTVPTVTLPPPRLP